MDRPVAVKQVIVMRTEYKRENGEKFSLRKGKLIAQGAHAAMAFLSNRINSARNGIVCATIDEILKLSEYEKDWLADKFTKICCQVDTEEELIEVYDQAKEAGLEVNLITDCGLTEFQGVPTKTCLAIGPDLAEKIDKITGSLRLY